ncbi:MAG: 54S ribosomal protein, mitochondrial [Bogoriella megaspora]|nr:MAG: 54S ribosomal protein, mitochondrial [Bogoriella megaspora]
MASKRLVTRLEGFSNGGGSIILPLCSRRRRSNPSLTRSMATEVNPIIPFNPIEEYARAHISSEEYQIPKLIAKVPPPPAHIATPTVLTTLYDFPSMEPISFTPYPSSHLALPLRSDLLHRAIIFEGDRARQGTASNKHRSEVHGSGKKIRRQKGLGAARLGDKKSPMLKGGGRAFAKKPRDFSTDLPRKMYDLAFRTALSWRWRRGQLVVVNSHHNLEAWDIGYIKELFNHHGWGKRGGSGRNLLISEEMDDTLTQAFTRENGGRYGKALERWDVDVKDLLKGPRVIIEKMALDRMLAEHQSDLTNRTPRFPWKPSGSPPAKSGLTLLK